MRSTLPGLGDWETTQCIYSLLLYHLSLILQDFFFKSYAQVKFAVQSPCQNVGGLAVHSIELGLHYLLLLLPGFLWAKSKIIPKNKSGLQSLFTWKWFLRRQKLLSVLVPVLSLPLHYPQQIRYPSISHPLPSIGF